jgi:cell division protein FtsW
MKNYLTSSLFLALLMLYGIGLVQVYSSSFIFATESYGDGLFFFKRQLAFTIIAIAVLVCTLSLPFQIIEKWGWAVWIGSAILVGFTFVPGLGVRVGGALRWLDLPFGLRFEPSELLKVSFSLWFASLLIRKSIFIKKIPAFILFLFTVIPTVILLKQPDFGSFAIITAVAIGLLFVFGLSWRVIAAGFVVLIPAFYFLVMNVPYRKARVLAFLDPWADPSNKGFQAIQSMLSFHSGGLTGAGLGQGQSKLFFLPEAHTDFTLAVWGEEMGFIGFLFLLSLYGFIIYRSVRLALNVEDVFKRSLVVGLIMTFGLSVFINSGVVLGMLPTKGLTLPFLSYGGSSLVVLSFMFGLILNVERTENETYLKRYGINPWQK